MTVIEDRQYILIYIIQSDRVRDRYRGPAVQGRQDPLVGRRLRVQHVCHRTGPI